MCKMPRGSDRLLAVINNEERTTHAHTHTHTHTHTHICKHPLPTFTQALVFAPSLSALLLPPVSLVLPVLRGALVFCMMSSWGASVFGRRLCLSYEMKKRKKKKAEKERETERKKEEDGEGG